MAADGNKAMTAKLEVPWQKEMKGELIKWVNSEKDIVKLFPKKITYSQKVELNPAKWNDSKLKNALPALVRPELQILANRISDAEKLADKAKSPKEHNKVIAAVKLAIKTSQSEIEEKCSTALEELESGVADAKAGLALGKKAMAEVGRLEADKVFSAPLEIAITSAKSIHQAESGGKDVKAAQESAKKEIAEALKILNDTGKTAQNVAKYLSANGKKMADNPKGEVSAFGKKVMDKKVLGPLQQLDKDIDKMTAALVGYAKDLKDGKMDGHKAKMAESEFNKMKGLQKTADTAVKEMQGLQKAFKAVQKDLK
ncbi:hypothetical protein ACERZ8_21650 [Tateyamaria armeniaca]|uniref:Uncharacterized protein n=1 Tax=Tateyamaria armeniaca TaxID=2518930 RepID=A0ABW8V287_9RHOB